MERKAVMYTGERDGKGKGRWMSNESGGRGGGGNT
jgi:hypothetical protein